MNQPIPAPTLEKLVPAAAESVTSIDGCYPVLAEMELPNDERTNVAIALLYASIEQGRSACFLVANDVEQSVHAALILLRSQIDQLMRAAFFAGPATPEELASYLDEDMLPRRNGNKLGPCSLSRINEAHFGWTPVGSVPNTVDEAWETLCGMTHGGRALLNYYIGEDGIGPYPPTDEFIEVLTNAVVLTHLAVTVALSMARNKDVDHLQTALRAWYDSGHAFFNKWAPKLEKETPL